MTGGKNISSTGKETAYNLYTVFLINFFKCMFNFLYEKRQEETEEVPV